MLGAIIGDLVGSRFEFNNHRSKQFELFAEGCFVTDDSIMTLAVAKAIMEAMKAAKPFDWGNNSDRGNSSSSGRDSDYGTARGIGIGTDHGSDCGFGRGFCHGGRRGSSRGRDHNCGRGRDFHARLSALTVKYMQEIGRRYPNCGFGGMFYKWVFSRDPKPYNSFGNGAAMRVSPVGFIARSEQDAKHLAETVTAVTHNHIEGIKGAAATAVAIYMGRTGASKSAIRERITRDYYPLDFKTDDIRATYRFNETCQETVPQAIACFLEATSFEDSLRTAISLGGDSDTIAAIAGAIAEAYYGVPEEMKEKALTYLDGELRAIYDEWTVFASPGREQLKAQPKSPDRRINADPDDRRHRHMQGAASDADPRAGQPARQAGNCHQER